MSGAPVSGEDEPAINLYRLRVLPAGKNDKVVEVSDAKGNIIKYLHSRYSLGNSSERRDVAKIKSDYESLSASEFSEKYHLEEDGTRK
ncbi:MAG: hypothetical protein M1455_00160 [Actinobacteria bacterium]|nr:hypothetical protein [Actinomycetota bacterium]